MQRSAASALAAVVVALVLVATLTPAGDYPAEPSICGLVCGELAAADALLNLAFFIPVGLAFRSITRVLRAVAGGFLLSLVVEALQLFIPGRHASIGDLLFNTLGAVAGALLLGALPRLLQPNRRDARRLALGWSLLVVAGLGLGAWMFRPSLHDDSEYYGQWTPDLENSEMYRGEVLDAHIGGLAIPSWRLADDGALRAVLESEAPLELTIIVGPAPGTIAPVFSIADQYKREILIVGARGDDLVYRSRVRASRYYLDRPDIRMPDALAGAAPGDTVSVTIAPAFSEGRTRMRVGERVIQARLTVADTWGLLLWPSFVARRPAFRRIAGILWLVALAAPAIGWGAIALRADRPNV